MFTLLIWVIVKRLQHYCSKEKNKTVILQLITTASMLSTLDLFLIEQTLKVKRQCIHCRNRDWEVRVWCSQHYYFCNYYRKRHFIYKYEQIDPVREPKKEFDKKYIYMAGRGGRLATSSTRGWGLSELERWIIWQCTYTCLPQNGNASSVYLYTKLTEAEAVSEKYKKNYMESYNRYRYMYLFYNNEKATEEILIELEERESRRKNSK